MARRKIITIDRDKCDGCGKCVDACAEGAIELVDGKAVLVADFLCDGFGDCLGECPTGALVIEEREVAEFDPAATRRHLANTRGADAVGRFEAAHERHERNAATAQARQSQGNPNPGGPRPSGCPGAMAREIKRAGPAAPASTGGAGAASELSNWPIQLHLVNPAAPSLREADLLIAADCTAFALGSFHRDLLRGRALIIACPKLDEKSTYVEKLAQIIAENRLASLTVARMEVPCCSGLTQIVLQARQTSGASIPVKEVVIGIQDGAVLSRKVL